MAYVIVNDFEGGTREQYDATTAVVHPAGGLPAVQAGQSVLPGPPKTTEVEVEVELSGQSLPILAELNVNYLYAAEAPALSLRPAG
jgi:hypothetical protein